MDREGDPTASGGIPVPSHRNNGTQIGDMMRRDAEHERYFQRRGSVIEGFPAAAGCLVSVSTPEARTLRRRLAHDRARSTLEVCVSVADAKVCGSGGEVVLRDV